MRFNNIEVAVAAGVAVGALTVHELSNRSSWFRRWLEDWLNPMVPVGTVSELYIHPIKSCRGHMVNEALCTEYGLVHGELKDRQFMVVNATTGQFQTARQLPKMVLIESEINNNKLTLMSRQGQSSIVSVDLDQVIKNAKVVQTKVFETSTDGFDCGDEVGDWLQTILGSQEPLRLIHYLPGINKQRSVVPDENWTFDKVPHRQDEAAYPDVTPYMAISQASLDNLNSKFEGRQFSMRNFRPNIVIAGCPEFDEDQWKEIRIGQVRLTCYKPCTRCVLPTVDPDTGIKDSDVQPLKMLREYRLAPGKLRSTFKQSPVFGVHLGADEAGTIKVGDTVYGRYKTTPF